MAASAATLILAVLALLSVAATARPGVHFHPCNTLLISYTISSSSTGDSLGGNPAKTRPSGFLAVYRIITPFRPLYKTSSFGDLHSRPAQIRRPDLPHRAAAIPAEPTATAFDFSSLQERAKDILLAICALLLVAGCGALTAATMYLIFSLVNNPDEMDGADGYSEEDEVDESPKKVGYVKIPATKPAPAK